MMIYDGLIQPGLYDELLTKCLIVSHEKIKLASGTARVTTFRLLCNPLSMPTSKKNTIALQYALIMYALLKQYLTLRVRNFPLLNIIIDGILEQKYFI